MGFNSGFKGLKVKVLDPWLSGQFPKLLEHNPLSAIFDYRPLYENRYPIKLSKHISL